ncbi:Cytochrome c oxidase (cbb3-type) subunit CcoN / Cytochrome c oxidase (cbb3-type) subunit CcoO [hydrothermal vent metagenome]|uniref:Cytochrome c oxidase (Cbb3-type) subunit CcoN / Cytochrome c oxidase (Cbb3-type) subunit CcoO n=1 Tax=hydrothermal vent metagenome TaxID=652676 RepID=A0A3B1DDY1_9ZZZZ
MSDSTSTAAVGPLEEFVYDDAIVRKFMLATMIWGFVGMLVGLIIALQLAWPAANLGISFLSFGRLRPLHTNAVIFAFAGNAIFTAVYYSTQRLCKCRMWSDTLSKLHFWGWQLIIVSAAITLPLGITQGKEYAELEWPIDLAIAVVWLGFFGVNFMMTLIKRRERHMYVALWFYIASIVTVTVLHVFNNIWIPAGLVYLFKTGNIPSPELALKSYPIYAGVQDAFMQWWYGHNAVAFFLTTPFLGLMYYFLPKAADRPVYSYRLSIVHFWSIVFIYIWAGPHHLHYTALPIWASSLGMVFSVMLWMPSWGGMINGLLTLRGAWHKVAVDPVLKFFVIGVTFYGMSTFEGPLLSIKTVNSLSHYTDWTIAHVHAGALGWNGFMTFGMIYWLAPRLFQTELASKKLVAAHFWVGTIGMLLYIIPIYVAGITQGLMWRAFDQTGSLAFPDFVETVSKLMPFYWARVLGGTLYLAGITIGLVNIFMTWKGRPATYEVTVQKAPALAKNYVPGPDEVAEDRIDGGVVKAGHALDRFAQGKWHRRWERLPIRFTVFVLIAVVVATLFEAVPMFVIKGNVPTIASVKPYTPLELAGRDIYIAEGCYNCHSQMIRPIFSETKRYGKDANDYSKAGEFIYDHPFQWGSRRIGPDLARVGGKQASMWHLLHFNDPRSLVKQSIMPTYPGLLRSDMNFEEIQGRVDAMAMLGVPYGEAINAAPEMARAQAREIAETILSEANGYDQLRPDIWEKVNGGMPANREEAIESLSNRKVIAIIAYLQRLGVDVSKEGGAQ